MILKILCKALQLRALHFFVFLFTPFFLFSSTYQTKVLSQTGNKVILRFTFDAPEWAKENGNVYALYNRALLTFDDNGAKVPVIQQIVNLPGKKATITVNSIKKQSRVVPSYLVDANKSVTENSQKFSVVYLGLYRSTPLFKVLILPVTVNPATNEVTWISEVELQVVTDANSQTYQLGKKSSDSFLKNLIVNPSANISEIKEGAENTLSSIKYNSIPLEYPDAYKITVDETGIYKITYEDLVEADFPVSTVNPQKLALYNRGKEIPIYFKGDEDGTFESADYFEFWGEKNEKTFLDKYDDMYSDPFSDKNVYWLVEGSTPGGRLIEENGGIVATQQGSYRVPYAYTETLHFEKDDQRRLFGYSPEKLNQPSYEFDNWFWGGWITAVSSRAVEFQLPYPFEQGNQVFVKAMFRGTSPIDGHQVAVWLNDQKVGEILPEQRWSGETKATITNIGGTGLSQSKLVNGTNILNIILDQVGVSDIVNLNWFDVSYLRKYRAADNFIKFRLQNGFENGDKIIQFEVDGFDSKKIDVYKLGISKIVNGQVDYFTDDKHFSSYRMTIQDKVFDTKTDYVAVTEDAKMKPLKIEAYKHWKENDPGANLISTSNKADLLIITNNIFSDRIGALKTLKEEQGFKVEVVTVQQIYDMFNYGIKSPLAIKDFLQYAYDNWDSSAKLKYVLLVGAAGDDYKETKNKNSDLVPTIMFTTVHYGEAPADLQYALLSGDDLVPDIIIGRIPASTTTELNNYIEKINVYQNQTLAGKWRNSGLFISGTDSSTLEFRNYGGPIFRSQSNRLINYQLPQNVFAYKVNAIQDPVLGNDDPDFGSNREIIDYFDQGLSFVNFVGHGGGRIWADQNLFLMDNVEDLNNENKYPFIASMTCYTGAFENVTQGCLGEKMLLAEKKGAIAVLASSSVGWAHNDFALEWSLFDYLWQDGISFGEAVDLMKIYYMNSKVYNVDSYVTSTDGYDNVYRSLVNQYNLLGDPTLFLQKPKSTIIVSSSSLSPASGEQIKINLQSPIVNGSGTIEISDDHNRKYLQKNLAFSSSEISVDFSIPQNYDSLSNVLKIKAYCSNGSNDASGELTLSVNKPFVKKVNISPEAPLVNQAISFRVIVSPDTSIKQMVLQNFRDENSAQITGYSVPMTRVNDTLFTSSQNYPGFTKAGSKDYEIYVKSSNNKEHVYRYREFTITDNRPDFSIDESTVAFTGNDQLQVKFDIVNNTNIAASNVKVLCKDEQGIRNGIAFYQGSFNFSSNERKTIYAPYNASEIKDHYLFRIQVDADSTIEEQNENNNIQDKILAANNIFIDYKVGTSSNTTQNDTLTLFNNWRLFIPANSLTASTVIEINKQSLRDYLENSDQKGLKYIRLLNQSDSSAFYFKIKNSLSKFTSPAILQVQLDTTIYSRAVLNTVSFFKYDTDLGLWVKLSPDATVINNRLTAVITENGLYGVFSFTDNSNPVIEVTANGRPLRDNMLVYRNPALAFLLQDENGINLTGSFSVKLDNQEVSKNEMTFPDTIANKNMIAIQTSPQLTEGTHTLEVKVADVSGKEMTVNRTFSVTSQFGLIVYGNYPNPFKEQTIISYLISSDGPIDDFSIKIYTTSGRLVLDATLDEEYLSPDYFEWVWDGRDNDGNEVANGVYFAIIKAKYKGQEVKKTIKMAKLK